MRRKPHECMSCLLSDMHVITMILALGRVASHRKSCRAGKKYHIRFRSEKRRARRPARRFASPGLSVSSPRAARGARTAARRRIYVRRGHKLSARKCPSKHTKVKASAGRTRHGRDIGCSAADGTHKGADTGQRLWRARELHRPQFQLKTHDSRPIRLSQSHFLQSHLSIFFTTNATEPPR